MSMPFAPTVGTNDIAAYPAPNRVCRFLATVAALACDRQGRFYRIHDDSPYRVECSNQDVGLRLKTCAFVRGRVRLAGSVCSERILALQCSRTSDTRARIARIEQGSIWLADVPGTGGIGSPDPVCGNWSIGTLADSSVTTVPGKAENSHKIFLASVGVQRTYGAAVIRTPTVSSWNATASRSICGIRSHHTCSQRSPSRKGERWSTAG